MKPIKITEANEATLEAALKEVNGTARSHTATVADLHRAAVAAERELADLGLPVAARKGAQATWESGDKLPNAYSNKAPRKVIRNRVTIERRATGWFLIALYKSEVWANQPVAGLRMHLTVEQHDKAVSVFQSRYTVQSRGE